MATAMLERGEKVSRGDIFNTQKKEEGDVMQNIIQKIRACHVARIKCHACGVGEMVYFVPESVVSELEVAVAKIETTTPTTEKSSQVGNAAAMREALVSVKKSIDEMGAASLDGDPEIMLMSLTQVCARLSARIEAALAAPPRNCDIGTAEEQAEGYQIFCHKYPKCIGCPCAGRVKYGQCEFAWSQMPYESEVRDADQ